MSLENHFLGCSFANFNFEVVLAVVRGFRIAFFYGQKGLSLRHDNYDHHYLCTICQGMPMPIINLNRAGANNKVAIGTHY